MSMTSKIAVCTAVIATVGAIFSYMGGATQANAGLYKNNAADQEDRGIEPVELLPVEEHQAGAGPSSRATPRPTTRRQALAEARWRATSRRRPTSRPRRKKLEAEPAGGMRESEEQMHQHHRWAQATTVLQVSIALAAIALLTKKKWLERAMFGVGGCGACGGWAGGVSHLARTAFAQGDTQRLHRGIGCFDPRCNSSLTTRTSAPSSVRVG